MRGGSGGGVVDLNGGTILGGVDDAAGGGVAFAAGGVTGFGASTLTTGVG